MRSAEMLRTLREEGFTVDAAEIGRAIKAGSIDTPAKRNLQFVFEPKHLRQIRKFLRGQSADATSKPAKGRRRRPR